MVDSQKVGTEEQKDGKPQKGGKTKMNAYFTAMLAAKKSGAASFEYKGNKYVGKKHDKLGMIYKKA